MKKTITITLILMITLSSFVFATEETLTFDLSSGGKNAITVESGSTVTVTFTVSNHKDIEEYNLNSIQNEIKYDESFFKFVSNSLRLTNSTTKGGLKEKFAGKRIYMNDEESTYKKEQVVGTFSLKVVARSGSGKVESTETLAYNEDGSAYTINCTDLTVTIGRSDDGEGEGGGAGGGGGGGGVAVGGGSVIPKYTKDIFGTEHPTHMSYINGYPDGTVRPDGNITREEIAAVLHRVKEYEESTATGKVFPDVDADRWSADEIEKMAGEQIILGYPDGDFRPEGNLTRAEFAALIYRFAALESEDGDNYLSDLYDTHWAYKEIKALCNAGLVEGYEDGSFKPENNITRAEVMTVINKILGRKPVESYVKALDLNPYSDLEENQWYYTTVLEATINHDYNLDAAGYEHIWILFE